MKLAIFLTFAFSTFFSNVIAECNMSSLNTIDVITINRKGKTDKQRNVSFYLMDSFKAIYITKANATELCEGMVKYFSDLEELYIIGANVSTMEKQVFQENPKLTKLSLAVNKLTTIKSEYVNQIKSLEVLYLSSNEISNIDSNSFDDMPNLKRIYLNRNKLRSINGNWFKGCPNLAVVDLSHNNIATIPAKAFVNIVPSSDNHVVQYKLSHNDIESISPEAVDKNMDFLVLMIDNNKMIDLPLSVFKNLQVNSLVLNSNRIACLSMDILKGMSTSFISLHLERNPILCDCFDKFEEYVNETEIPFYFSTTFNCKLLKQITVLRN